MNLEQLRRAAPRWPRSMSRTTSLAALVAAGLGVLAVGSGGSTGSASASTSTEAGRCTKAEATAVVKRLRLGDPFATVPVFKVLCGSFAGPGSQTMVASLLGEANTGMIGWAVFRLAGGQWQLLMERRGAAELTAAGADIRETVSIYRPSDPRCCPSGGTKSRTWHWNGSRFTASAWTRPASTFEAFHAPGGIQCSMVDDGRRASATCWSGSLAQEATLRADGRLTICRGSASRCKYGDIGEEPRLTQGKQVTVGRFRCTIRRSGVTCVVTRSGKGFLISRGGVKRVGA